VLDWLHAHYSLDENPGMGQEGFYYYLHLMTKALVAANVQELTTNDGKKVDWKAAVAQRLIGVQNGDGFWLNDEGGFMENDKVLVTSYGVLTLDLIFQQL
jgi:squalene-hopene/tetraprenyl-beta-curcumene cyclase